MTFAFTAPQVSTRGRATSPLDSILSSMAIDDLRSSIFDPLNKASEKASKKVSRADSIANLAKLFTFLVPQAKPFADPMIDVANTLYQDAIIGDLESKAKKAKDKGFFSSQTTPYYESIKEGRKDMLKGGALDAAGSILFNQLFNKKDLVKPTKPEVPFNFEQGLGDTGNFLESILEVYTPQEMSLKYPDYNYWEKIK